MRTALSLLICLLLAPLPTLADDTVAVVYLSGDDSLPVGSEIHEGDYVNTFSGVMLKFPDGSDVELAQNTCVRLSQMRRTPAGTSTRTELLRGGFRAKVPTNRRAVFTVVTPVTTVGVRGTDFSVEYTPASSTSTIAADNADVDVYEGTVEVGKDGVAEAVESGNGATVTRRGVARRRISEKVQERWQARRQEMMERVRAKFNLGPDADVSAAIRERLKNLSPEKREEIRQRLESHQRTARERVRARAEKRRQEVRPQQQRTPPRPGVNNRRNR